MAYKRKMTDAQLHRAKKLAERMKGHPEITNPHALARWQVQRGRRKKLWKAITGK